MNGADPGDSGWAADVELDLMLLGAKSSTLDALDMALDIGAGLAAIRAQHERGGVSRSPPEQVGPGSLPPLDPLQGYDQLCSHDDPHHEPEGPSS